MTLKGTHIQTNTGRTHFRKGHKLNIGRITSEESKEKNRAAHLGKIPWNKGKKNIYSEETLNKMRIKKLGRKLSEEHKRKIGSKSKGNKYALGSIPWNKGREFKSIKFGTMFNCKICNNKFEKKSPSQIFCNSCYRIRDNKRHSLYAKSFKKICNARRLAFKKIKIKDNCEICDSDNNLQRHHWDYEQPLLVNTLCSTCHRIQHTKDFENSAYARKEEYQLV